MGNLGPKARSIEADWVREVRDQCIEQNVPFFFKQWGGVQKKKNGRILDGVTWDEMPTHEFENRVPPNNLSSRQRLFFDIEKEERQPLSINK